MILRKTSNGWQEIAPVDRCPECDFDWRPAQSYRYGYRPCNCQGADHRVYVCADCGYQLWVPPHDPDQENSIGNRMFADRRITGP